MRAGILLIPALLTLCTNAPAQTGAPRQQVVGRITNVDASAGKFTVTTDKGDAVSVAATDATVILHMPPGVTDVQKGTRMKVAELSTGDRVVTYYRGAAGEKAVQATSIVVRTVADLAETARQERADWRKRGTAGVVTAVDPQSKTITLRVGQQTITAQANDKTQFHRYSPDSARPADASDSTIGEIKVGDQANVLGDKSADGTSTTAESVYAGTFRQLAATVVSIDAAAGEMQVKDLATKKNLTVRVDSASTMKKLDPQMAAGLAKRFGPGRKGASETAPPGGGRGGGDIGSMLDRLPVLPLSDLKAGDAVMLSTTLGSDPSRVKAIMLLAGVEPLLTAAPNSTRDIMSGWNLSGGGDGN